MNQSTKEAYAEVDTILELMDTKYIMEIPRQLREMFKSKKSNDYNKIIVANKPLQEQNLNPETLEILAVLNYNYWCKDENKKKELLDLYCKNDLKKEQEKREKYNPDNLFKNNTIINENKEKTEDITIAVAEKNGILNKIIKMLKGLFSK